MLNLQTAEPRGKKGMSQNADKSLATPIGGSSLNCSHVYSIAKPDSFRSPANSNENTLDALSQPLTSCQVEIDGLEPVTIIEHSERPDMIRSYRRIVPSWLTSFLAHLLILVSIAFWGIASSKDNTIGFEAALARFDELDQTDLTLTLSSSQSPSESEIESIEPPDATQFTSEDLGVQIERNTTVYSDKPFDPSGGLGGFATTGIAVKPSASNMASSASASEGDGEQGDVEFFGATARGTKFVYVLDCSGSMGGARWELTRKELFRSLDSLKPDRRFLVLLYNTDTWAMFNTQPKDTFLVEATAENIRKVKRWVSGQLPGGSTFPKFAMASALSTRPDAIFLLSDGEFQDNTVAYLAMANVESTDADGVVHPVVPVHTLAMDMSFGVYALQAIAANNAGKCRVISSQ